MRIRLAVPDRHVSAPVINAALESVTRANEASIRAGDVPLATDAIRRGKVRWKPEGPGDEHFDLGATVYRRGWGDCDDLAPWLAAERRVTGTDPEARAVVYRSGPSRWHAVVERGDGTIEDPSRAAGMGQSVSGPGVGYAPPVVRPMPGTGVRIAVVPWRNEWAARADAPFRSARELAIAGHGYAAHPRDALITACAGSVQTGESSGAVSPVDVARLAALHDTLRGARASETAHNLLELGVPVETVRQIVSGACTVGFGLFGGAALAKSAGKVAKRTLGGRKKSGAGTSCGPMGWGPVIVRF